MGASQPMLIGPRKLAQKNPNDLHERCADCAIRHRAVCTYCGSGELEQLDAFKFYRNYHRGQEIVAAGEETEFLGSVVEGIVSLSKVMPDGRRQSVGLMFPSDFIGRPMRPVAPFDAVALTPVRLCLFSRSRFTQFLNGSPALEKRLLEMTLDELDAAHDSLLLLGKKNARERIATFLCMLARRAAALKNQEPDDGLSFEFPLTREAVADYLGLTIETVSRQLTALRKEGVIDLVTAHQIRVPNYLLLLDVAGENASEEMTKRTGGSGS